MLSWQDALLNALLYGGILVVFLVFVFVCAIVVRWVDNKWSPWGQVLGVVMGVAFLVFYFFIFLMSGKIMPVWGE